MIKDKGTLAPPLIRQTVRQPWQPQKGRQIAIKNKNPLTEEKKPCKGRITAPKPT
jgi:hypothetical protein